MEKNCSNSKSVCEEINSGEKLKELESVVHYSSDKSVIELPVKINQQKTKSQEVFRTLINAANCANGGSDKDPVEYLFLAASLKAEQI